MPPKSRAGNRNFGLDGPGKGDKSRVSDLQKFKENYDAIDWSRKSGEQHPFVANPNLTSVSRRNSRIIKKYK